MVTSGNSYDENVTDATYPVYPYDERIIDTAREQQRSLCSVYRVPETMVVMGRGSKADQELRLDRIALDAVPVYRRRGGGCTVVLDSGNIVVAFATPQHGISDSGLLIRQHADYIISSLQQLGLSGLKRQGISDIVQRQENRLLKISGSCVYRPKGLFFFSATLLVGADLALIDRYTTHPPREPTYRQGRSHEDFVGNLALPENNSLNIDTLIADLADPIQTTSSYTLAEGRAFENS